MVDFKAQLEKGVKAHKKASAAKQEVRRVLDELTSQVAESTGNRVGITLKEEFLTVTSNLAQKLASITSGVPENPPLNKQFTLVAYDKSRGPSSSQRLASWTQNHTGYPCTLRFEDTTRQANDRQSLESILGMLLASPETGRVIYNITSSMPDTPKLESKT